MDITPAPEICSLRFSSDGSTDTRAGTRRILCGPLTTLLRVCKRCCGIRIDTSLVIEEE